MRDRLCRVDQGVIFIITRPIHRSTDRPVFNPLSRQWLNQLSHRFLISQTTIEPVVNAGFIERQRHTVMHLPGTTCGVMSNNRTSQRTISTRRKNAQEELLAAAKGTEASLVICAINDGVLDASAEKTITMEDTA